MSRATTLLNRTNNALRRVGPWDRTVYKRVITRTGGDALIGRSSSVTYIDTEFDPQPTYERVGRYVVGQHVPSEYVVDSSNMTTAAVDYQFTFTADAISKADLSNPDVSIVMKDAAGKEEVFRITDVEPVSLQGQDILFITFARSTKQA